MRELLADEWTAVTGGCGTLESDGDGGWIFTQCSKQELTAQFIDPFGGWGFGGYGGGWGGSGGRLAAPSDTPFWIAQDHIDFPVPELDPVPPHFWSEPVPFRDLSGYNWQGFIDRVNDELVVGGVAGAAIGALALDSPNGANPLGAALGFVVGGIGGALHGAGGYIVDGGGPPDGPKIWY